MKLTKFTLYKNTPFTDFQNTIHFSSNAERDSYFDGTLITPSQSPFEPIETSSNYNYIRDKSSVVLTGNYHDFIEYNYCRFSTTNDTDYTYPNFTYYYAYILSFEYLSENSVRMHILIDGVMTHCQGETLRNMGAVEVLREHLPYSSYKKSLERIRNNDDVIKTTTKKYIFDVKKTYTSYYVLFQSTADLSENFGDVNSPILYTSTGGTVDRLQSPKNLYICKGNFQQLMSLLSPFPWITQNISNAIQIPSDFFSEQLPSEQLNKVTLGNSLNFDDLYTFKNNFRSPSFEHIPEISLSVNDLYEIHDLDKIQDQHLIRNEYMTYEFYTFDGQALLIDASQLNMDSGLQVVAQTVLGYENMKKFYIRGYKSRTTQFSDENEPLVSNTQGAYLNESITLANFKEVSFLVDNSELSLAKSANVRKLAESKLITNRTLNILNNKASMESRIYDLIHIATGVPTSIAGILGNVAGKFTDEYEYYRTMNAEQKDLALQAPETIGGSDGYNFQIANELLGVHLKVSSPDTIEWQKIKDYYKLFGYESNQRKNLSPIDTMSLCNFVQFRGNYQVPNADMPTNEMMKIQFEIGVRFWHIQENNMLYRPWSIPVSNNVIKEVD